MSTRQIFSILVPFARLIILVAVLAGLVLAPPYPASAAAGWLRYVSPTGSDPANDCRNSASPCKTIAHALSVALDQDHIYLDAGVYPEHSLLVSQNNLVIQKDPFKACPIVTAYLYIPCPTIDAGQAGRVIRITGQNVWLEHLTITGGKLTDAPGAGILNEGVLSLDSVTVTNNVLEILTPGDPNSYLSAGGGVSNQGQLTVLGSSIYQNTAFNGGGIYSTGKLLIIGSQIYANTAILTGGGLDDATCAEMTVETSSFWDNQAQDGGAILIYDGGVPQNCSAILLRDITVSENSAVHVYGGPWGAGGLSASSRLELDHATFFNNHSSSGSPVDSLKLEEVQLTLNPPGQPSSLKSTIVAHAAGPAALCAFSSGDPSLESGGHNLSSDASCGFTTLTDLQNTDPRLLPLADNGGLVRTCALLGDSPAIDHGGAYSIGFDARGVTPRDGNLDGVVAPDIGAFEFVPFGLYLPILQR
jgi:predicted outer membrane repeat protein